MTQNNIKIAITGGIGSGKSTVCQIIKEYGYPVYSCDEIYNEVLTSPQLVKKLADEFGCGIISNGIINRKTLAEAVFSDREKLKKLNALTHPEIMSLALKKMEGRALSFLEVPLLFENNFQNLFNGVIVVLRDFEARVKAASIRDGVEADEIKLRVKNQFDYDNFDFSEYNVIHNCGNLGNLRAKTVEIIKKIESAT